MATNSTSQHEERQLDLFGESTSPQHAAVSTPGSEEIVSAALDHLNEVTGRAGAARFTSVRAVKERIREGATLEDVILVIDFCHAMWWGDARMETYIRPKTLFGKENFPEYVVRARKWDGDGRPSLLGGAAMESAGDRRLEAYSAHVKGGTP